MPDQDGKPTALDVLNERLCREQLRSRALARRGYLRELVAFVAGAASALLAAWCW